MKLYVKNLTGPGCKMVAKTEVEKLGLHYISADSGELEIQEEISEEQFFQLKNSLRKYGLGLLKDKKSLLVEGIKNVITDAVRHSDEPIKVKFSEHLSTKLNCSYRSLAKKFLEVQGTTIEKHFISSKIEKVKELLLQGEFSLTEIAYKLNYSSVAHLSNQFKKVTGLTPSGFKETKNVKRLNIENKDNGGLYEHAHGHVTAEAV